MKWTVGSGFKVEFLSGCRAGFWAASKSPLYGSSSRRRHSTPSTEARSRYGATTAALGAHRVALALSARCTGVALVPPVECTGVVLVLPQSALVVP